MGLAFLTGCTASYYRKQADKEVYQIIQDIESGIFGHTNQFTIDTAFSGRAVDEIPPSEIVVERLYSEPALSLDVEDALQLAMESSRRFQDEKERLYLTALSLTGARYEFTPHFFAGTSVTGTRQSNRERLGQVNSRAGVTQFLKTGGRLSATLANDLLRFYTGNPRNSAISVISVNLLQPLLRGAGSDIAAESLTQAERNVVYAVRSFSFFQAEFATQVVNDYYQLLEQKDIVRNRYTNYLGRVRSTERLEARAVDRQTVADVDQARQAELTAKNSYINSVANYENALDRFKITLGLPLGAEVRLDDRDLLNLQQTGLIPVDMDAKEGYQVAVEHQLEILNSIDRFEDAKRKVKVAANQLRADLDIIGNASLQSEGPTDYTEFDPDRIRATAGIELDLPIDRLRERNNYRATLVSFESQLRTLSLTLDELRNSIERGLRTLAQLRQNYEIQQNALELANRRVESTDLRLQAGLGEVRDLIEAQDAQIAAQNAVTSALVAHQQARLQLMIELGLLDITLDQFWLRSHTPQPLDDAANTPLEQINIQDQLLPPNHVFKD